MSIHKPDTELNRVETAIMNPSSTAEHISMTIAKNGAIRLETTKLQPEHPIVLEHETLPSDIPEVHRTVLQDDQLSAYDKAGNTLFNTEMKGMQYPEMAQMIQKTLQRVGDLPQDANQMLTCVRSHTNFASLVALINQPTDDVKIGYVNTDSTIVTIRQSLGFNNAEVQAQESVNIIDLEQELLLATRIYDADDRAIQSMMYMYDDCQITGFKQESLVTLPSGATTRSIVLAKIDNLSISTSQKNAS